LFYKISHLTVTYGGFCYGISQLLSEKCLSLSLTHSQSGKAIIIRFDSRLHKVSMRDTGVVSMTFLWQNHDQTCAFTPVLSY